MYWESKMSHHVCRTLLLFSRETFLTVNVDFVDSKILRSISLASAYHLHMVKDHCGRWIWHYLWVSSLMRTTSSSYLDGAFRREID